MYLYLHNDLHWNVEDQAMYQKFLSIIGAPCSEQGPSFFHTIDDKSESQYLADLNEYTVRRLLFIKNRMSRDP